MGQMDAYWAICRINSAGNKFWLASKDSYGGTWSSSWAARMRFENRTQAMSAMWLLRANWEGTMARRDRVIKEGPMKGYKVLGHDKDNPCPKCGERAYCKDCGVCTSCGHTVKPD